MSESKIIELKIPQIGEGLFSVKVIDLHKNAGDEIKEDEVFYSIETDKTAVDIESAHRCRLVEWLVNEQDVVEVGSLVARAELITTVENEKEESDDKIKTLETKPTEITSQEKVGAGHISPRVRHYALEQGLTLAQLQNIPAQGEYLTLAEVDNYIGTTAGSVAIQKPSSGALNSSTDYQIVPLSKQQMWLGAQFKRSMSEVVPASIVGQIDMALLKEAGKRLIAESNIEQQHYVSDLQVFAYLLAQTLNEFPIFKSTLIANNQLKQSKYLNLGLAVQSESGDLVTALIDKADQLSFEQFDSVMKEKIAAAAAGKDQAQSDMPVILSYMGSGNLLFGAPLLVSPAIATLFLSAPQPIGDGVAHIGYLSMTFDHRVLNGMDIARFFDTLAEKIHHHAHSNTENKNQDDSEAKPTSQQALDLLLVNKIAELLNLPVDHITKDESLGVLGVDSIKAVKIKEFLEQKLVIQLSGTVLWHYPTVNSLVNHCAELAGLSRESEGNIATDDVDIDALINELGVFDSEILNSLLADDK